MISHSQFITKDVLQKLIEVYLPLQNMAVSRVANNPQSVVIFPKAPVLRYLYI